MFVFDHLTVMMLTRIDLIVVESNIDHLAQRDTKSMYVYNWVSYTRTFDFEAMKACEIQWNKYKLL